VTPEEEARREIDRRLGQCGWIVQDYSQMNISAGPVATREFPLTTGHADYMLYVDGKAIGVVEAKPIAVPSKDKKLTGKVIGIAGGKNRPRSRMLTTRVACRSLHDEAE